MKRCHIFFTITLMFTNIISLNSQTLNKNLKEQTSIFSTNFHNDAQVNLKLGDIDKALIYYAQAVKLAQSQRNSGRGVSGELLSEYAYTLALNNDFEAALINIDRARMIGTKYADFYSAQILSLMGYDKAAEQLMKQAQIPNWINGIYQGLTPEYTTTMTINQDSPEKALTRANRLAANKQKIQAMALFEELTILYPTSYITYIDYSTIWESLGYYDYASQLLKKGIDMMPKDMKGSKSEQIFTNHLNTVNTMKDKYENAPWVKKLLGMEPPKFIAYAGASVAKNMFSLNGRIGEYTSNQFSASLNFGMSYASKQISGNLGLSAYKAWNAFVIGMGLNSQYSKNSVIVSFNPSIGLTFLNKAQTSSFDIMFNGYVPFSSKQKFSYNISIGKTFYFDLNGLLK